MKSIESRLAALESCMANDPEDDIPGPEPIDPVAWLKGEHPELPPGTHIFRIKKVSPEDWNDFMQAAKHGISAPRPGLEST